MGQRQRSLFSGNLPSLNRKMPGKTFLGEARFHDPPPLYRPNPQHKFYSCTSKGIHQKLGLSPLVGCTTDSSIARPILLTSLCQGACPLFQVITKWRTGNWPCGMKTTQVHRLDKCGGRCVCNALTLFLLRLTEAVLQWIYTSTHVQTSICRIS